METKTNEYYGRAFCLSDNGDSVCCAVQEGTGNTVETSNIKERWFPQSLFKDIIGNDNVKEDYHFKTCPYFKIKITEKPGTMLMEVVKQEPTSEIVALLNPPDYFADFGDTSFLNSDTDSK